MDLENDYKYHMAIEDWDTAIGIIDRIIADNDTEAEWLYFDRGYCYFMLKQWEDSLIDFSAYIDIRPDITGYKARILVLHELGRFEEALEDHDRVIQLDDTPGARYEKMETLLRMEAWHRAIVECSLCILLYPKDRKFYIARGEAHHGMKDFRAAINDYTKAWSMCKKDSNPILKRAFVKEDMLDYSGALLDYDLAAGMPRNSYYAMINKARLLFKQDISLKLSRQ